MSEVAKKIEFSTLRTNSPIPAEENPTAVGNSIPKILHKPMELWQFTSKLNRRRVVLVGPPTLEVGYQTNRKAATQLGPIPRLNGSLQYALLTEEVAILQEPILFGEFSDMTLTIALYQESPYKYFVLEDNAAGFERYRYFLWGSKAMASRDMNFFPQLREHLELEIEPHNLEEFQCECRRVMEQSDAIAAELWPVQPRGLEWFAPEIWMRELKERIFPKSKQARITATQQWGGEHIRNYMKRFLLASDEAKRKGLGVKIG